MYQILIFLLSISGLTAFAIWIGKLVITKTFDLGIEKYKSSLQKDLEDHKTELSRISLEHQIRFSRLHEERAAKIKILYEMVIDLEQALIFATTVAQGPEYPQDVERDNACIEKIRRLIHQLDLDKIYFTNNTVAKFDSIIKESWDITFQMKKVRRYATELDRFANTARQPPEIYYSEADLWTTANSRTENEFRILKEQLTNEFRELLGI